LERLSGALPPDFALLREGRGGTAWLNGAIRVFGEVDGELPSIASWNEPARWVGDYGDLVAGLTFFAEDAFGNQFAWDGLHIERLAAESGRRTRVCQSPREWWELINEDPDEWAVAWLHDEWVSERGPVGLSRHLAPKIPFVLGSNATVNDLFVVDRWEDMSFKASLATQLRDTPPGTKVRLKFS
jgi:hypothetical protein